MKFSKKIIIAFTASNLLIAPVAMSMSNLATAHATTQPQRMLSLGASLTAEEIEQTKALLGANSVPIDKITTINGETINNYLQDGSNANTGVYSSALIEPLPAGSGVQVQIITPNNIQLVKPVTYQNAAITSGATDVLIKIATVKPVTGEGALTGVYALLEKSGVKVDRQSIVVAEKEIQVVEQAKTQTTITDNEINTLIVEIKIAVTNLVSSEQGVDGPKVVRQVLEKHPNLSLPQTTIDMLVQLALDYAKTEVAKNTDTVKQLDSSINTSTERPYAVDLNQYGGQATFINEGKNVPSDITVSVTDNTVSFNQGTSSAPITVESIDTKEVTARGSDGSTRTIKVNTLLRVGDVTGNPYQNLSGDMYLFVNRDNKLALLTPNYAGNTDNPDVMLEYIVGEPIAAPEAAAPETTSAMETTTTNNVVDAPYAVDTKTLETISVFKHEGNDTDISFDKEANKLYITTNDTEVEADVTVETIPTEIINILNADGSGNRQVKVNTVLKLSNLTGTNGDIDYSGNVYLFTNAQGKTSLIAPNYYNQSEATTVDPNMMIEYVIESH